MGWQSDDCVSGCVTEARFRDNAQYVAEHLAPLGYKYVIVGPNWSAPANQQASIELAHEVDQWGRAVPAESRFPSAKGGAGFGPLARHVHGLGLSFGIHLSRGIPRTAVQRQLPVKGTDVDAAHIANRDSPEAEWTQTIGVDSRKRGAQAYYDSVFELLASWEVDYVDVGDISGDPRHASELEAIREAIDKAGRTMVLGISGGVTPIEAASYVAARTNLWQIGDGIWDDWNAVRDQLEQLRVWSARSESSWPHPGPLPLGRVDGGTRRCLLDPTEQRALVSLWSTSRSPLIVGGEICALQSAERALLTNPEILAIAATAHDSRVLFEKNGLVAWVADIPDSTDKYVTLINARDRRPRTPETELYSGTLAGTSSHSRHALAMLEVEVTLPAIDTLILDVDCRDTAGGRCTPLAVWGEPRLLLDDGTEQPLTALTALRSCARRGSVQMKDGASDTGHCLRVAGDDLSDGIVAHAPFSIEFRLPPGVRGFSAICGRQDDTRHPAGQLQFRLHAFTSDSGSQTSGLPITITKEQLGLDGPLWVRDLWHREELGVFPGEFTPNIPWHGAGVYRVSDGG